MSSGPSLISRYYILFFEKFIQKIPSIPSYHLTKWSSFKELIQKVPIPIEGIHNIIAEMFEFDKTTPLETLEKQLNPLNVNPPLLKIDSSSKLKEEDQSPRQQLSPHEKKTAIVIKNFRSQTHDFNNQKMIPNPFLVNPQTLNSLINNHPIPVGDGHKISDDWMSNSPLIGKISPKELHSHHMDSKFKTLLKPVQKKFSFKHFDLLERIHNIQTLFVKHSEILETISLKAFEITTPHLNSGVPSNENFSNWVTKNNNNITSPQQGPPVPFEPLSPLKRMSIFAKPSEDNKPYLISNLDKYFEDGKNHKFIYK